MKKNRFFVILFCLATGLFLLVNFVVWTVWVEDLRTSKYAGGDLARLGYLSSIKMPRPYRNDLPMRHLEYYDYQGEKIDVLTIGDSFSNTVGLGENVFYQDHLATIQNLRVLNIIPKEGREKQPQTVLIKLYNSGELDRLKPRYVLLESVERLAIGRLGKELDFKLTATEEDLKRYKNSKLEFGPYRPLKTDFISNANFKYLYNCLLYFFSDHNSTKRVYIAPLRQKFFSVPASDVLAYLFEDTRNIKNATPEAVARLNDNLNILATMLEEKGITLIFMPIVDKFNLYRDYLVDDNLPRSHFFEALRPLDKKYMFIDTKALLSDLLVKGEKDVFFADDTHWTSKAGAAIFSQVTLP